MAAPISYKEFLKNPIVGLLFLAVLGLAYLQMENAKIYQKTIEDCRLEIKAYKEEVKELKGEIKVLQDKIFEMADKR